MAPAKIYCNDPMTPELRDDIEYAIGTIPSHILKTGAMLGDVVLSSGSTLLRAERTIFLSCMMEFRDGVLRSIVLKVHPTHQAMMDYLDSLDNETMH